MKAKSKGDEALKQAREVLKIEAECILGLIPKLDQNFSKAVETIFGAKGRVIVSGIGKSGLIGRKIVATFTSTGTPAIFLHPVEGMHGDLGIVTKGDVLIAISNSGETAELNELIARIGPIGLPLIITDGKPEINARALRATSSSMWGWPGRPVPSAWHPPPARRRRSPWEMPWPWP